MRVLIILAVFCLSQATALRFDAEACTTLPELPTPREINATFPQVFDTPGFNFSDPEGSIYPGNTQCEWRLFNEDPDQSLVLSFFNFSLEYVTDCMGDFVSIYDGDDDTAPLLATLCGPLLEATQYTASNDSLFVRFVSNDNAIEREGFLARAGAPIEVTACDGTAQEFTTPYGSFFTPNFPVNYGNDLKCDYYFEAPAGQSIEISFSAFDLAQNCNDDVIAVYEGAGPMFGTLIAKYYADMRPARMTIPSNAAWIEFTTDNTQSSTGFAGYYQFV